ncbi:MAG: PAS domain S-box protein [Spirochaetes bacterium]|nr:PAS domain S-box protein [Spirochaetota bacterium]
MDDIHGILMRQLEDYFGSPEGIPELLREFIGTINDSYRSFEERRKTKERSLELASEEMLRANWRLMNIGERLRLQNEMLLRLARRKTEEHEGLDPVFAEVTEIATTTLRSDKSCIFLLNDGGTELSCAALYPKSEGPERGGMRLRYDHRDFFMAIDEERTIAIADTAADTRLKTLLDTDTDFRNCRSILCAPIRLGGRTVGALLNLWIEEAALWFAEEEQFAASLADYVSNSIEYWQWKNTETDLVKLREQELGLLKAIPHGVIGLENRRITFANEAMHRVFGWLPEEIIGRDTRLLYRSDEDFHVIGALFYPALERERSHTAEFPCVKRDGTVITCRVSAARIGEALTGRRIVVVYEDITDSINAARELDAQKRFSENLLQSLEVPAFVIDRDHRVRTWNTACELLTGYSAEELVGTDRHWMAFYRRPHRTLADIIIDGSFDEIPHHSQVYSKSMFVENSWHGEGWYDSIGGTRRYMIFDAVPIYDERGELVAAIETLQDITRQKGTEEALRRSENIYRTIFESTGTAMLMIEEDTIISLSNSELQRMTGYSKEEIEGKMSWTLLVDEADLPRMKKFHISRRRNPLSAPGAYEFRMKNTNGTLQEVICTITMVPDTKRSVASLMDISQLKSAERQMERMRFFLQSIIDSMPSIIIGLDREGRITQWNMAAGRETGLPVERALGLSLSEAMEWFLPQAAMVRTAMEERSPQRCERLMQNFGDSLRYIDIMVYPLIRDGIEGAVVRIDDVTERVRIDEMIIQTEKMISVGGLAAGMAHEINNPLSGILLGTENIARRIGRDLKKNEEAARELGLSMEQIIAYNEKREIPKMLENIREMGLRAASIVSNMLSFSRKSSPRLVKADIVEIADRTLALAAHDYDLKRQYDFRHISIVREYAESLPMITCNPTEIEQVLLNLLRNAAQEMMRKNFAGEQPLIVLRLKRDGENLLIEVEDNGPGIEETNRMRVFEPFFTTKEPGVGTGLGLSVSYFIITSNHGGSMAVESEPGKGAKFIIRLPASPQGHDTSP